MKKEFYYENEGDGPNAIDPGNDCSGRESFKNAALEFEDAGDYENAISSYYQAFIKSGRSDFTMIERMARNLIDAGKFEQAAKAIGLLAGNADQNTIAELRRELAMVWDGDMAKYSAEFMEKFLCLFGGREGVYASQFVDPNGRIGYRPVREHFEKEALKAHLDGEITAGIYPLRLDGTVKWIAFDIDVSKHFLNSATAEEIKYKFEEMKAVVTRLRERLNSLGIEPLVEDSGHKGYHLWCFFHEPVAARIARRIANIIIAKVDIKSAEFVSVEVFPKQSAVGEGGIGNLIKIPLGIHKKTGRRCVLVDPVNFTEIENYEAAISAAGYVPVKIVDAVLRFDEKRAAEEADQPSVIVPTPIAASTSIAASALIRPACRILQKPDPARMAVENADKKIVPAQCGLFEKTDITALINGFGDELKALAQKCGAIGFILKKAFAEKHLTHDERLVLLYTFGFVENGGKAAIHSVISNCTDYKQSVTEAFIGSRRSHCMGCVRIRQRLSGSLKNFVCECKFDLGASDAYPSPLVHINRTFTRSSVEEAKNSRSNCVNAIAETLAVSSGGSLDETARRYLELKKRYIEVLAELKKVKMKLKSGMKITKTKRIELMEGLVSMIEENGYEKLATIFSPSFLPRDQVK